MSTSLLAIRAELAALRLQIHQLECAEKLIEASYQLTVPQTPPQPRQAAAPTAHKRTQRQAAAPATRKRTPPQQAAASTARKRSSGPNPTRTQLREHIFAHAPVSRRELLAAFSGSAKSIDNKLRAMVAAGEIAVDGPRGAQRYRPPDVAVEMPRPELVVSAPVPARGLYPVYDAIVDRNGATTEQLVRDTGLPAAQVVEQGRRLRQLGLVRFTGVGETRKWLPVRSQGSAAA
jgi:hypothetical protein